MTQTDVMAQELAGRTVVDTDGSKIGKVSQVFLDDQTNQPEWVSVTTGLFGTKESFVPLRGADYSRDDIVVQVSKDIVKGAPQIENDGHIEVSDEQQLYRYYSEQLGAGFGADSTDRAGLGTEDTHGAEHTGGYEGDVTTAPSAGHDTSGPTTDDAMTRSEERLRVGTENVEAGRARLRKYVVTENVTQTVPVSHEEVRIEREPIIDENRDAALSGPDISEEEHEVTLHAERPVVAKEAVAVERVKIGTEVVTEEHQVDEQVRKEQIDFDDADVRSSR